MSGRESEGFRTILWHSVACDVGRYPAEYLPIIGRSSVGVRPIIFKALRCSSDVRPSIGRAPGGYRKASDRVSVIPGNTGHIYLYYKFEFKVTLTKYCAISEGGSILGTRLKGTRREFFIVFSDSMWKTSYNET